MSATFSPDRAPIRQALTDALVFEMILAFGLGERAARSPLLRRLAGVPSGRFVQFVDRFDQLIWQEGLPAAARWIAGSFIRSVRVRGLENLPASGPLLVASNHPGALDSVCMLGAFPRDDTHIFVSGSPFFKSIPASANHCIFVEHPEFVEDRRRAIRLGIEHLQSGGSVLIYPTGQVDPEPAFSPDGPEAIRRWSPSLEIMLRKAPQTRLVLTVASDVLMEKYAHSLLTRLVPAGWQRQRLAEYLQIIQLLFSRRVLPVDTLVSFAPPLATGDLIPSPGSGRWMEDIIAREQALFVDHLAAREAGFAGAEEILGK